MRDDSERLWKEENKVGSVFKFDYDLLLSLIPSGINFRHSELEPRKNENNKKINSENQEE